MTFDPMSAYTAVKVAAELSKENNWAKIMIVVLIVILTPLLIFMMLPMVLFSNPIDTPEIQVTLSDYLEIANDLDISYAHLISFDTGQYNNDFGGVSKEDVLESAFKFFDYTIKEYEVIEKRINLTKAQADMFETSLLNYDSLKKVYYYYETQKKLKNTQTIKTVGDMKRFMNVSSLTSASIKSKLDELKSNDLYEVFVSYANFDTVVSVLDEDMQLYAIELLQSGIFESAEFNFNLYDDVDLANLIEYDKGDGYLPYYNQADKRWAIASYGTSTIVSGGCGPTSLAMVVAGLTKNDLITPKTIADWSVANGHRAEGQGSYWSLMTAGGSNYGLNVEAVSRNNPEKIRSALKNGYPVIASMGSGHFTRGGHFIVLYGVTNDGKIIVYDSASLKRTQMTWDLDLIMRESSKNGGENGSPFWIFKLK